MIVVVHRKGVMDRTGPDRGIPKFSARWAQIESKSTSKPPQFTFPEFVSSPSQTPNPMVYDLSISAPFAEAAPTNASVISPES